MTRAIVGASERGSFRLFMKILLVRGFNPDMGGGFPFVWVANENRDKEAAVRELRDALKLNPPT
jgi:hypothetical protein